MMINTSSQSSQPKKVNNLPTPISKFSTIELFQIKDNSHMDKTRDRPKINNKFRVITKNVKSNVVKLEEKKVIKSNTTFTMKYPLTSKILTGVCGVITSLAIICLISPFIPVLAPIIVSLGTAVLSYLVMCSVTILFLNFVFFANKLVKHLGKNQSEKVFEEGEL